MKKRLIVISLILFLSLLASSLTTAIFTPTIPTSCDNTQIMSTWNSIFKESFVGITIISNTSESGRCNSFVAYKISGNIIYLLYGNDFSEETDLSGVKLNATSQYITIITNISSVNSNEYHHILNEIIPATHLNAISLSLTEADLEFKATFKQLPSSWQLNHTVFGSVYIFSDTEWIGSRDTSFSGLTGVNYSITSVFYRNTSLLGCTPNWTAHNTTCQSNDKLTQYFTDSKSCGQSMSNLTFTCDFNQNGVMGSLTNFSLIPSLTAYINSSTNLTRMMSGIQKVELKAENYTAVEFDWNFSQVLDLDRIYIERQSSSASRGYLLIRGIPASKKIRVQKLTNSTIICARNEEINSISDITSNCTSSNEISLACPSSYSGISCYINESFFVVSGLTNSAVTEVGASSIGFCTPNWNCTNWTTCGNGLQTRNCADTRACNSSMPRRTDTQACAPATPLCTTNWLCENWTACSEEGTRASICRDKNYCNTTSDNKKTMTENCEYKEPTNISRWLIIAAIALIMAAVIILIIYFLKKKPQEYTQLPPRPPAVEYGYPSQQGNQGN